MSKVVPSGKQNASCWSAVAMGVVWWLNKEEKSPPIGALVAITEFFRFVIAGFLYDEGRTPEPHVPHLQALSNKSTALDVWAEMKLEAPDNLLTLEKVLDWSTMIQEAIKVKRRPKKGCDLERLILFLTELGRQGEEISRAKRDRQEMPNGPDPDDDE